MGDRLNKFIMMGVVVFTVTGDDLIHLGCIEIAGEGLLQRWPEKGLLSSSLNT